MRLRKNMKRTAAAVLALSMAVSAVAAPASAAYICDVSQGNVVVSKDESGTSITVGGKKVENDGDGTEDIIITGDNTKPTESLNAEDENTSEVEKSGETEGEGKTQNSATEGNGEDDEPTSQELLTPEDEQKETDQKKDEQKPADSQEPEQTEKTSDQVIEYDQYDPEAQKEVTKPAAKPAAEQETGEKKAAEEKTYGDTNAPTSLTEKAQAAARNVVSIINNFTTPLKVILRDLKVDAGDTAQNAMTIKGKGNVTLELDGKTELTGGSGTFKDIYGNDQKGYGIESRNHSLTVKGNKDSSLTANGGAGGGLGIYANGFELDNADVTANGGSGSASGIYVSGNTDNDPVSIKNSKLTATGGSGEATGDKDVYGGTGIYSTTKIVIGEGSEVVGIGGNAKSENGTARSGSGTGFYYGGLEIQKGGKLTVIGGKAESEKGKATGGAGFYGDFVTVESSGETTFIGGNAKSESGIATGGSGIAPSRDNPTGNIIVKEGTTTALGGTAEGADGKATNGNSFAGSGSVSRLEIEENSTFVTAKPGESGGNGISGGVSNNGKIEEVKNAEVVKKDDGTVEVVGNLVGVETGNHKYKLTATVQPTCTTPGKRVYTCTTEGHERETYEETIDALGHEFVNGVCTRCGAPESNGGSSAVTLTVTGAGAYETSIADGRYVVAAPAETAVLSGCLGNLKELKAQGVNTLVFRTQLRETALDIDSMLSLGVDDTLFTLTHNGESAELTVGGFAHNELLH